MDRTGEVLENKYQLARLLGEGGMGAVYEAQHTLIGRRCAVKFLHPEIAKNPEVVKRFIREAQAASAIGHKGIIDIYDVGTTADGSPYLVMEFLDGKALASYLGGGRKLDVAHSVEVVVQALSALAVAHRRGIVHRDLKPDNLYVVQGPGQPPMVKLLDFGISKMSLVGSPQDRMTRTGTVLGTPYYMAPEQAAGKSDIDHRLDLYAMGVILYECLTGRVPFEGDNYNQLIVRILTESFPRPTELEPSIPPQLEAIILKAMARERDNRYATAEEMLKGLLRFLTPDARARLGLPLGDTDAAGMLADTSSFSRPPEDRTPFPTEGAPGGSKGKSIGIAAAAALVVIVGVTLALWQPWAGGESSAPAAAAAVATPDAGASESGVVVAAAAAADGTAETTPDVAVVAAAPDAGPAEAVEAPRDSVTISFKDLPVGTVVLYDGAEVQSLPLNVKRGSGGVVVEIRAPGLEPYKQMVVPDRDQEIAMAAAEPTDPADAGTVAARGDAGRTVRRTDAGGQRHTDPNDPNIISGRRGTQMMTGFE